MKYHLLSRLTNGRKIYSLQYRHMILLINLELNPMVYSLDHNLSCRIQSKALERSKNNAYNFLLLLTFACSAEVSTKI
jgi:hypothetical protein